MPSKTDLFAFFVYHAFEFLRPGGRLGFVTSSSWLTSDYGYQMQLFLLEKMRDVSVISSDTESFFNQVDQNTVLLVAEKRSEQEKPSKDEVIRFITLKQRLNDLFPQENHWQKIENFVSKIEGLDHHFEDNNVRIHCYQLHL